MKLNRNYAGIPYLYRKNGAVSTVMEIVMKEAVDGAMLQAAVNFTVSRHPYFKSSLQERQGDYYIAENEMPVSVKEGYALPEVPEVMDGDTDYRYAFTLNNDSLMAYSKKIGASPAIVVALLVSKAIHSVHPDADKPVLCSMASNLREGLHAENTFKNCVNSINLPYNPEKSFEEQSVEYKQIIKAHKEENYVKQCANGMVYLFSRLDQLDSLEAKKAAMAMFDNIRINSYSLSYTGRLDLTECEKFIERMHLYSGGNNGLFVNMMSVGNTTTVDILQSFTDEAYVNTFKKLLSQAEIEYTVSDCITFTTPRDGIADTPAVASVRERIDLKQYVADLPD